MEVLYDKNKLTEWEDGREERIQFYEQQRLTPEEALRQGAIPKTPKQPTKTEWPQPDSDSEEPPLKSTINAPTDPKSIHNVSKKTTSTQLETDQPTDSENNETEGNIYSCISDLPEDLSKALPIVKSLPDRRQEDKKNENQELKKPTTH